MRPTAFRLFHMYYLGLTPEFEARFYNLNALARHFQVLPETVSSWLADYHLEPEVFPRIRFNVAQAHGKAQDLALLGKRDEAAQFARKSFEEFVSCISSYSEKNYYEDVNYDDIWGDGQGDGTGGKGGEGHGAA